MSAGIKGVTSVAKATIRDVDLRDKRCFCRVDYNVPMKGQEITDDTRIRASLPTVKYLMEQGAKIVLASHLGRPKGKVVDSLRLDPVAQRLSQLLSAEVKSLMTASAQRLSRQWPSCSRARLPCWKTSGSTRKKKKKRQGVCQATGSFGRHIRQRCFWHGPQGSRINCRCG